MFLENLTDVLRAVSEGLLIPVILVLLLLIALTVILFGTLVAELFTERMRLNAKLPQIIDAVRDGGRALKSVIAESGLLKRQKAALSELISHGKLTPVMREALARRLLFEEQNHYEWIVKISDMVARIGPMAGLMGTLIPLGPGLIALGQGDTYTLSQSLLVAFDTTVAGLCAAAVSFVISAIRKSWYENYMTMLESLMNCVLDREAGNEQEP